MMLAYVGPESVMPVASAIAAFFGFLLIGWRWIITRVKAVYRFIFRIKVEEEVGMMDHSDAKSAGATRDRKPEEAAMK